MKITNLRTIIVNIPLSKPIKWSFGIRKGTSTVIVFIETDEGITGIGETKAPYSSKVLQTAINEMKPILINEDPFDIERIKKKLLATGLLWCPDYAVFVISGIEIALWDIIGKCLKKPIYELIGGKYREKVSFAAYIFIDEPKKVAEEALKYVEQGFSTIKLKVGINPEKDIEMVKEVRNVVGNDIKIRVDANQAWSPGTAIKVIKKMEKYDLEYVEQPVHKDDIDGMKRIRMSVSTPIAVNEGVYTIQDALNFIKKEAADIIVTDIHNPGGISECKKLCAIAEAADIPVVMHSGAELGIGLATMLHIIASTSNFIYANDTHYPLLSDDIIKEKFSFKKGSLELTTNPGLGVTIDEGKLELYTKGEIYSPFMDKSNAKWIPTSLRF